MPRVVHFEIHATEPKQLIAFYSGVFGRAFTRAEGMDHWLIGTGRRTNPASTAGSSNGQSPAPRTRRR